MTSQSTIKVKTHAVKKLPAWVHKEPKFDADNYNISLVQLLNFFNIEVDDEDKKSWVLTYWKEQKKSVSHLHSVSAIKFKQIGVLVRLINRGVTLSESHMRFLDDKYNEIGRSKTSQDVPERINLASPIDEGSKTSPEAPIAARSAIPDAIVPVQLHKKPNIQDRIEEKTSFIIGEMEGMLDDFYFGKDVFNVKVILQQLGTKSPMAKKVAAHFKIVLARLNEIVDSDEQQIKEGYSNFGKVKLRKYISMVSSIIDACDHVAVTAKNTKLPRKKKEKPASVVVSKMKYMREFPDLKLRSLPAEKIIGSDTIYMYDTASRKLHRYVAQDGYLLSVKGSTLCNWCPEKSGSKTLRKPAEQLKDVSSKTKRPFGTFFNSVASKLSTVSGRTNENMLIVGIF